MTLLVTGLYGKPLAAQNGSRLRLAVPWKYVSRALRRWVKIRFEEHTAADHLDASEPGEYGFYGNVNPQVPIRADPGAGSPHRRAEGARPTTLQWVCRRSGCAHAGLDLRANY